MIRHRQCKQLFAGEVCVESNEGKPDVFFSRRRAVNREMRTRQDLESSGRFDPRTHSVSQTGKSIEQVADPGIEHVLPVFGMGREQGFDSDT